MYDFHNKQTLLWELFQIRRCKNVLNYAKSKKVASSIPVEIIGILNLPNPSSRTMALRPTQPLTEIRARNLPGGKWWPARNADLTTLCEPIF
jgi:hypothetical protein